MKPVNLFDLKGIYQVPTLAWQPALVFLPGESHGQRSLAGYSSWGRKETTEATELTWMSADEEQSWEAIAIIQQEMVVAQHKSN